MRSQYGFDWDNMSPDKILEVLGDALGRMGEGPMEALIEELTTEQKKAVWEELKNGLHFRIREHDDGWSVEEILTIAKYCGANVSVVVQLIQDDQTVALEYRKAE